MTSTTELRVLGPVGAWRDGAELPLGGTKQRTVLAALLLAGGQVVSDDRLSRLLWDWDPPATRNAQIYTYVSRLRHQLGPGIRVLRRPPGYLMDIGDARFDGAEFERLSAQGRQALAAGDVARAGRLLQEALALWRGPGLGHVTEPLADAELPMMEEARLTALEHRVDAELALGEHQRLVAELTSLVAAHPLHERFRAQLMTALHRCDRQSDALAVYHEGRLLLAEELGVDPGPALAIAHQAVLSGGRGRDAWAAELPVRLDDPSELSPAGADIETGYRRLPREARAAFRRLGRRGGLGPERDDLLEALADAALIDLVDVDQDGRPRYRVHDNVLRFAAELAGRLTLLPAVRPVRAADRRHSLPV